MNHKPIHALAMTVVLCTLGLLLHTQAAAQSATTSTKAQGAVPANQPGMMVDQTPSVRLANGNVLIDEAGTVQTQVTNDNGAVETVTISKPTIDVTTRVDENLEAYVTNYTAWLKANPNYADYVSREELELIEAGNWEHLYKLNYYAAQNNSTRK